jgi:hypothetical protein
MLNVIESPLDSFTVVQGRNAGAYIVSFAAYVEAPFLTAKVSGAVIQKSRM